MSCPGFGSLQHLLMFLEPPTSSPPGASREEIPEKSHPWMEQHQPKKKLGLFELGKGKQRKINCKPKYVPASGPFPRIKEEIQTFCTLKTRNISLLPSALPALFSLDSKIIEKRKNQGFLHWFPWLSIPSVFSLRSTELCKYFFGLQWQKIIGFSKWMREKKVVIIQPKYGTQLA